MSIEVNTNNPLGLTVAGPGAILYPEQTGDQISGYGFDFASFPDQTSGINAGIDYIQRHIQSGKAKTVQDLVNLFSPHDLAAFEQTTGLSASDPLDPNQAGLYAAGIAAGEGTLSSFGGISAFENAGLGASSGSAGASGGPASAQGSGAASWLTDIEDFFVRSGLIVIGAIVIVVALWQLLSDHTPVPSPAETVKIVGKTATTALAAV